MSIEQYSLYKSFILSRRGEILWTLNTTLTGTFVAGLIISMFLILHDMSKNNFKIRDLTIEINGNQKIEINRGSIKIMENLLSKFIGQYQILPQNINTINPGTGLYGWWIKYFDPNIYYLFEFSDPDEFIGGFITGFDAFEIDFRNYIAGPPFIIDGNGNKVDLAISGYYIQPFNANRRKPAPITPFYTGAYEADPYGQDYN
jgi:hypothetical protein